MSQFFNNDDIQKAINKVVSLGLDNFMFQEPSSNKHCTSSKRCTSRTTVQAATLHKQ